MKSQKFEKHDTIFSVVVRYVIILIFCAITVYPILNILSIALRPGHALFSTSLSIIPDDWTFDNFVQAFTKYNLFKWLFNSFLVSGVATLVSVVFSVTAGYAFSRFQFWGKKKGLMFLLITQMFPVAMMMVPLYILLIKAGMVNIVGLVIVYVSMAIPFSTWMMKGYFDTIPRSLEESAFVDGAKVTRAFYQIILPLAKPAIAITSLFSFMTAWSEYIVARLIFTDTADYTIMVGLVSMQGRFNTDWGIYSAAALVTTVPVMAIFIWLSKYLVSGLTVGSVKG